MPRLHACFVLFFVLSVAVVSCKKPKAPPLPPQEKFLRAAVQVQGGIALLKAASALNAAYKGELLGAPIKGTMRQRGGDLRLEYVGTPWRNPVSQVAAKGHCWQRLGRVVVPCTDELRAHSSRLARLLEASWIWPLREGAAFKVKHGTIEIEGKKHEALTIFDDSGELGSLALDTTNYAVVGLKMETTLRGQNGPFVGVFSEFEDHCRVKMPTRRRYTFAGKPFADEKITGISCGPIEDKVFEMPLQVEPNLVEIRHTYDTPLACTKLKGPMDGVQAAMGKVSGYLAEQTLSPEGPALLIHRKGPPQVKQPAKFVTDVCFPVSKKAWVMPKKVWKGEFFLGQIVGDEVLAGFGWGDLAKTTQDLPTLLVAEAHKQGRKQAGSPMQILWFPPSGYPAAKRASEMHLPLD